VEVADALKVPSYIRVLRNDAIRSYTPGQTSTVGPKANRSSEGDEVKRTRMAALLQQTQ